MSGEDRPSLELPSLRRRKRGEDDGSSRTSPGDRHETPEAHEPTPTPRRRIPTIAPLPGAVLTGVLVGLVTVGLVWVALRGCSGLRGTSSCGGPGVWVLLALFVLMTYLGRAVLAVLHVPDAGSTAFLGMALVAVVALLFVGDLSSALSAAVLAVIGAAAFGLSQWVTSTFTEPGDRPR